MGLSGASFATAPTSGQLIVINGLQSMVNGSGGSSASSALVVVNDASGPCSTSTLAIGGTVTVSWNASNTHSTTKCTDITSVNVSAVKTSSGTVQYDSTANSTPPATATAATVFTAPTTAIANLALIITGGASAATTNSATVWGSALGVNPVYSAVNGALTTTGVPGSVGISGLKAAKLMRNYGVLPITSSNVSE